MKYIDSFSIASFKQEEDYILERRKTKADMTCYSNSIYPFNIFTWKKLHTIEFENITIICGGNGCGKSTLLNIIAEKLGVMRRSPFNYTPYYEDYLKLCSAELTFGRRLPETSRIITSDDVFDFLLDIRSLNVAIDRRREDLFIEYNDGSRNSREYRLSSLDDYDELKRRNDARRMTKSQYVGRSLPKNLNTQSNGESAFTYFTQEIRDNALLSARRAGKQSFRRASEKACGFYNRLGAVLQLPIYNLNAFALSARNERRARLQPRDVPCRHMPLVRCRQRAAVVRLFP